MASPQAKQSPKSSLGSSCSVYMKVVYIFLYLKKIDKKINKNSMDDLVLFMEPMKFFVLIFCFFKQSVCCAQV